MTILFVCESKGKIEKISNILGPGFIVQASDGHFRDLDNKTMSIDFDNNFSPIYVITKPYIVDKLNKSMRKCDCLYLASDCDREGEAIAQHLYDVLKPKKCKRLIFNAITRDAILNSIKNSVEINKNLVDAQKARRILDRLFGYLISPILSQHLGKTLSAGRVQSVCTKIIIDKENEIKDFFENNNDSSFFRVSGKFQNLKATLHKSNKSCVISSEKEILIFLNKCLYSTFSIKSITENDSIREPVPPFETSTLQEEANRKFGFTVDLTMKTAQKLYESGYITYMRTDSVEISKEGHENIKKVIIEQFGEENYRFKNYKNKSSNSQEAHEAIRPTYPDLLDISNEVEDEIQIKLYKLIWQRTIASQMSPAKIHIITIQIEISKYVKKIPDYYFQSQIEKIIFPGFMQVYIESKDEVIDNTNMINFKGLIPKIGDKIIMINIIAKQDYKKPPSRFSEAMLVKTMKKIGIGRPSTYVNTIQTIKKRQYVTINNIPGISKKISIFKIASKNNKTIMEIDHIESDIVIGKEKSKICATPLGISVNDFLVNNFPKLLDYQFTAKMENKLDKITDGKLQWDIVIKKFYDYLMENSMLVTKPKKTIEPNSNYLGTDNDGNQIYAITTKYGPALKKNINNNNYYKNITNAQLEKITLEEAIKIFEYPKELGKYNKKVITLNEGKYGLYLKFNNKNFSVLNPEIKLKDAIEIIKSKTSNSNKI